MTVNKDLPWKDISNESYREYIYESGFVYRIEKPVAVAISASGGHRVYDLAGIGYYVIAGWAVIKWEGHNEGEPQYEW
jgi:hypothetical protein